MVAALFLFATLVGCARTPDVVLSLSVDSKDAVVVGEAHRILQFRFDESRTSFMSSVQSEIRGPMISFRFKRGAPEESILTYLYQTPGKVHAFLASSSALAFTDRDIEHAGLSFENGASVLQLRLSPAAGRRVRVLTSSNVGKAMRVTLDGQPLLEATITGVLSDSFQISLPQQYTENASALAVVLQSGALPAPVSLLQLKNEG
jgi:preprotein translocase subunit SecD